ncbi:hypothetical protein D0T49_09180 [Paludibacter sp. 221]|nr:hypothetical protein [Paludibacter sp. 221]
MRLSSKKSIKQIFHQNYFISTCFFFVEVTLRCSNVKYSGSYIRGFHFIGIYPLYVIFEQILSTQSSDFYIRFEKGVLL